MRPSPLGIPLEPIVTGRFMVAQVRIGPQLFLFSDPWEFVASQAGREFVA